MKPWAQAPSYKSEAEQQAAGILSRLLVATSIGFLFGVLAGIYYHDVRVIATLSVGITILIVPFVLLRRGRVSAASITFTLLAIGTLTASAMAGQGINDLVIVVFPIIYFFASVSLSRTAFRICLIVTLLAVFWLTFGELNGWFVPQPFPPTSWVDFLIVAVVLAVAAFASDLLATTLRKNLERAEQEITDRKRAEEALREAKETAERYLTISAELIIRLDSQGTIALMNDNGHRLLDYSPGELIGKNWFDTCLPKETRSEIRTVFQKLMNGDIANVTIYENKIITKNGNIRLLLWHNSLLKDKNGRINGLLSSAQDITERKQAEEALRESEERYRDLVDNAPTGILAIDTQGQILSVNPRILALLGSPSAEATMGINVLTFGPLVKAGISASFKQVIDTEKSVKTEHEYPSKWGKQVHVYCIFSPIKDANGSLVGVQANVEDITERKQAEDALRESSEKYRLLIENINDAVAITQKGKYIYFNQQFCQMLGYTAAEMDHKDYREVFSAEGLQILAARQQVRERGEEPPTRYETIFVRKDGQLINIEVSVTTIVYEGQPAAYAVLREITERKRAEAEIAESLLSAKQANSVKDQFIANISHEIRTPLNSIIGFSDLFRQRYADLVNVKDKDIFGFITNSGNRLMRTVDSILNISQLDSGSIKIEKREFDLNYIVRAVIGEIKPMADEKGLDLIYGSTDQYAMVCVDNYSIHQAILNITENAIKYTHDGKIELSLIQQGDRFRLSIQDTGIGISEEYIKRIFTPYTQESEGYTKNFQGIGLGLALTKRYLDLNGVDFELKSEKNVGTTFTLIFPTHEGNDHV